MVIHNRNKFLLRMICIAAVFIFAGCRTETKEQQIRILDGRTETMLLIKEGTTVRQALAEAEISIGKNDVVTPSQDSVISEDITKILIERFAKVSVSAEGQEKEFTFTGAKVSDAIEAAKIELTENDSVNHDLDAYLTNGMGIEVVRDDLAKEARDTKGKGEETKKEAGGDNSERTIISKEKIYDCDGSGHGYYSITWSDGSVEYEDF